MITAKQDGPHGVFRIIYVDTLYGNHEMLALRNHLMGDKP